MLKIADKPFFKELKEFVSSDAQVSINLSDPYFYDPVNIRIRVVSIVNEQLISSFTWEALNNSEDGPPALENGDNTGVNITSYCPAGTLIKLTVRLKNGSFQYYTIPVATDDVPEFISPCEHSGTELSFNTFSSRVTVEVDNISIGEIIFDDLLLYSEVYTDDAIQILYYYEENNGLNTLTIRSNFSHTSIYTPKTIKFIPLSTEDSYDITTNLSNFPFVFDGDGYTTQIDLNSLPYDTNEYFIANNCCFEYNEK